MQELLAKLQSLYPKLKYTPARKFYFSPDSNEIFYNSSSRGDKAMWSLLHETGHALLGHRNYRSDFELIRLEIDAWEKAKFVAKKLDILIDEGHIQDCLDTYRDWLHKRSICPTCTVKSLQQGDIVHYRCFNCHTVWRVSADRFTRAYRSRKNVPQSEIIFT